MFDFMNMMGNHEARLVANFKSELLTIDTCMVTDSDQPYETGISVSSYEGGKWIIVEMYDCKEEAQKGHDKWVEMLIKEKDPHQLNMIVSEIKDVSTSNVAKVLREIEGENLWE